MKFNFNNENKTLLLNLFSVGGIQIANYLLPIITIPYIVRVIGADYYGIISYAQSIVAYFTLFVNYSFEITATREISVNRFNLQRINYIFSTVIIAKTLLFVLSSLIFFFICFLFSQLKNNYLLYLFTYAGVLGNLLFPNWLYLGFEKLGKISFFSFILKLFFTLSIFVLLKEKDEFLLVPILTSLSQIVLGILTLLYAIKTYKINLIFVSIKKIKKIYKDGFTVFFSSIITNLYTTSNILFLGFYANNFQLGYYAAAAKFIGAVQALILIPINQSFFPYIGKEVKNSFGNSLRKLRYLFKIVFLFTLLVSLAIFIWSPLIINILFGNKFNNSITVLRIMAFLPFLIGLSNVIGIHGFLNLKKDKIFLFITSCAFIINLTLNLAITPYLFENGTALSWLLTEFFVLISFVLIASKNKIKILKG